MAILAGLGNLLFPYGTHCALCEGFNPNNKDPLCKHCRQEITKHTAKLHPCEKCGRFIAISDVLCAECKVKEFPFTLARGVAPYEGILKEKIHFFKYLGKRSYAVHFVDMMLKVIKEEKGYEDIDAVVAVPLHNNRLEERTFNQAEELGQKLAKKINKPYIADAIWRVIDTPTQVSLNRIQRSENLSHAFSVPYPEIIKGKNLLLIDDIFTTGTTVSECTKVLLNAGARHVAVLTVASGIASKFQKV